MCTLHKDHSLCPLCEHIVEVTLFSPLQAIRHRSLHPLILPPPPIMKIIIAFLSDILKFLHDFHNLHRFPYSVSTTTLHAIHSCTTCITVFPSIIPWAYVIRLHSGPSSVLGSRSVANTCNEVILVSVLYILDILSSRWRFFMPIPGSVWSIWSVWWLKSSVIVGVIYTQSELVSGMMRDNGCGWDVMIL